MIKNIAVIGAGAVGSFFLDGLSGKKGINVFAVADGERRDKLEKDGLIVNRNHVDVEVRTLEQAHGVDLVVVCVKYNALIPVLAMVEQICDGHTIILCPMNGVDTEEVIAGKMGREHIIHSMMIISAERVDNNIVYNTGTAPCVHFGRAPGYGKVENDYDADLEALKELCNVTGLVYKCHKKIITTIWNKFALNISTNIAQAIIGCNYGAYKTSPYMNALGQKLCDELLAVAKAKGIECTFDNQRALKTVETNDCARFSTLQDIMAGRHTEIDMFCGAVVQMGNETGVPTPFNEFAWLAIKALEEKNDGKISC